LLDYFLGLPFWNVSGKARGSYKKISCVVNQEWGFEYKSTPSACFANPKITGICVKILSKVVKDYFAGKDFTIHKERDVSNTQLRKYAGLDTEEITYFRQFLDTFSKTSYKENILAAWVKEFPETKPAPLKVVLADHWASKKKKVVQKAIDEAFTKVKFSKDIDICIFGLGSERGNVVSGILEGALPSEDISYVNADAYNYSIGVPLSFREGSSSLDKATQSKVLEDIIKTIQNIFNDFVIAKEDTHELLA